MSLHFCSSVAEAEVVKTVGKTQRGPFCSCSGDFCFPRQERTLNLRVNLLKCTIWENGFRLMNGAHSRKHWLAGLCMGGGPSALHSQRCSAFPSARSGLEMKERWQPSRLSTPLPLFSAQQFACWR